MKENLLHGPSSRQRKLALIVLVSSFFFCAFSTPAFAAPDRAHNQDKYASDPSVPSEWKQPKPFRSEDFAPSSSQPLSQVPPKSSGGDLFTLRSAIPGNPYNCHGQTENVHKSGGMSSVHTRIRDCGGLPQQMTNGAEIMKKGWFGWWHRSAFSARTVNNQWGLDTFAKAVCGNQSLQTYRGNGYHRVEISGTSYVGRTSSPSETRFACDS